MNVMLLYWGRRGLSQFAFELADVATRIPNLVTTLSLSTQNELFAEFRGRFARLLEIQTFASGPELLATPWRLPRALRQLSNTIEADRIDVVVDLMPHVWSPFAARTAQRAGALYVAIAHDADAHPGDRTALLKTLSDQAVRRADLVIALSEAVARRLKATDLASAGNLVTLFHPDLRYGDPAAARPVPRQDEALRLLFLGRIMPYKGLSLFLDCVEYMRRQGRDVVAGIYGEGPLGAEAERVKALGVTLVNRWLSGAEIAEALQTYHILVASHLEASQSGTVSSALGAGLPVVVTPVGGLREQIEDGVTGVVAPAADAAGLATAINRLTADQATYRGYLEAIASRGKPRSMETFLVRLLAALPPRARRSADPDRR